MPKEQQDPNFPIRPNIQTTDIESIAKDVSEEEFDQYLVAVLQDALNMTTWSDRLTSSKNFQRIPGLSHVPLICKADQCEFAEVCPIMRELNQDPKGLEKKEALRGKNCRVDLIESAKLFSQWIRELEIRPQDTTDLLQVTSLVRYIILQRRVEWEIQMCGVMMESVAGISNQGQVVTQKVPNALLKELQTIQNMINSLTSQLSASRQDKLKTKTAEDKIEAALDAMMKGYKTRRSKSKVIDLERAQDEDSE